MSKEVRILCPQCIESWIIPTTELRAKKFACRNCGWKGDYWVDLSDEKIIGYVPRSSRLFDYINDKSS